MHAELYSLDELLVFEDEEALRYRSEVNRRGVRDRLIYADLLL